MVPAYSSAGLGHLQPGARRRPRRQVHKPKLGPDDVAFLQYTGGTTGVSKGATLLHRNVVANVLQNDAWLQPALAVPPHVDAMMIVCALPLYHIFALTACYLLAVRAGGCNLLIPNPRDIDGFIKELQKYQVNSFPAVNTLYNGLMHHPDFRKIDFSKLKISNGGGMAVQRPVAEQWKNITGCPIAEGYGLSETSPALTCNVATSSRIQRHDRHSRAVDLDLDPRRRRQGVAVRRGRRNLRQGSAGDGRLLEQAGRDRQGDDAGRLLPHRRHRRDGRRTATPRSSTARRT